MIELVGNLSVDDLELLAKEIRSGRLPSPFSSAALTRYLGQAPQMVDSLGSELKQLCDAGMKPEHIALLLELGAAERRRSRPIEEALDLVSTGPEAGALVSRDTGVVVRELFSSAREHVLVVGYAVHKGRSIFETLAQRMAERPDLKVTLCLDVQRPVGDTSLPSEIVARFAARFRAREWPGKRLPAIYFDPRSLDLDPSRRASLHAKCVVADREVAFISSANFTEAAQVRNIEVGVLVRSTSIARRLAQHFESLIAAGALQCALLGE